MPALLGVPTCPTPGFELIQAPPDPALSRLHRSKYLNGMGMPGIIVLH